MREREGRDCLPGRLRRGFTLIELLAVMGIMLMLAAVALTSYFGAMRGAAMRSAVSHLHDTLALARQSAIMNQRGAHVIFSTNGQSYAYSVCLHFGTGWGDGTVLTPHRHANRTGLVLGGRAYNLNSGSSSIITAVDKDSITTEDPIWSGTCAYGWEVHSATYLPRGFRVKDYDSWELPEKVVFKSDGTTRAKDDYEMHIVEDVLTPPGYGRVKVAKLTGFITSEITK